MKTATLHPPSKMAETETKTLAGKAAILRALSFLLLILIACLSIYSQRPPRAIPASAPVTEFSSSRAMNHVRVIASQVHPIGSPAHKRVRYYLLSELSGAGLQPQVQTATVLRPHEHPPFLGGTVNNVVARLNGSRGGKAILLMAHYDSAPNSFGASDDGSGVAAVLETLRTIKAGPPLKNDVIVLFTDGEESGLLGAQAFLNENRWANEVGLALNFEARGTSGPSLMFETSDENGTLIEGLSQSVLHPITSSLLYDIYRVLPNDTDLSVFKKAGFASMNFAYINGVINYHTGQDNVANIDERSLQHQGDYAVALTRHFGDAELGALKKANHIYFTVPGLGLIHYSAQWVFVMLAIVALTVAAVFALGFKREKLRPLRLLFSWLIFFLNLLSAAVIASLCWWLIRKVHPGYNANPLGDTYNRAFYMTGFALLTVAIVSALYALLREKIGVANLAAGALIWWLICATLTSLYLPGGSYLFTWPLLFALLGFGHALAAKEETPKPRGFALLCASAVPAALLLIPIIYLVYVALTLIMTGVVMALVVLLSGLLVSHFSWLTAKRWVLPAVLAACSMGFLLTGSLTYGFSANAPKQDNLFYAFDAETGKSQWVSFDADTDEWTSQFFSSGAKKDNLTNYFPGNSREVMTSQAPALALAPPELKLLENDSKADSRLIRLRLTSPRQASAASIYLEQGVEVIWASVNGKDVKRIDSAGVNLAVKPWSLYYYGLPAEGIELTLEIRARDSLKISVVDQSYGLPDLPGIGFKARPPSTSASLYPYSDSTLVKRSFTF